MDMSSLYELKSSQRKLILMRNIKSGADLVCRDVTLLPMEVRRLLLQKKILFVAVPSDPHVVMYAFRSLHRMPDLTAMIVRREWTTDNPVTAFRNRPIFTSTTWNEYLTHFARYYLDRGVALTSLVRRYEPDHRVYHLPFLTEVGMAVAWCWFGDDEDNLCEGAASVVKELLVPHFSFAGLQAVGEKAKRRAQRLLSEGWHPQASGFPFDFKKFVKLCVPNSTNSSSEQ